MPGKKETRPNPLLRRARETRGWTQQEVAERVGAPYPFMVNRWENGVAFPSPLYRTRLAALFGQTVEELGLLPASRERSAIEPLLTCYDPVIPLPLANAQELVGRDELLAELRKKLCVPGGPTRLAMKGLPGVGKTALAARLASDAALQAVFNDGILWAGVGPQPNLLALFSRWGNLLGVSESVQARMRDKESWIEWLHRRIGTQRMLIVIDDAWTLEDALACAPGGPNCAYLLTTRIPEVALAFAGTMAFHLPELGQQESRQLLIRLAPALAQFDSEALYPLVQASGGLPLALTLLGHHLFVQAHEKGTRRLQMLLQRLQAAEERISLSQPQAGVQRDFRLPPSSALSLQTIIGLSETGLEQGARQMLSALAVLPAKPESFTESAALSIAADSFEPLDKLVDAGLVECVGADRYTLHQTIADYARTRGQNDEAEKRAARYYLDLLLQHSNDYLLLEREIPNLLCALQLAVKHAMYAFFVESVLAFVPIIRDKGMYRIAMQLLEQAQNLARECEQKVDLIALLLAWGQTALWQGMYRETEEAYQEALYLAQESGDAQRTCFCLVRLGGLAGRQGKSEQATGYFQDGLSLARQLNDQKSICQCLHGLGTLANERGEYERARHFFGESLAVARQLNSAPLICNLLNNLGSLAADQADFVRAEQAWQEALTLGRQQHLDDLVSLSLVNLGSLASEQSDFALAEGYFADALLLTQQLGNSERMGTALWSLSSLLRKQQKYSQAQEYIEQGLDLSRTMGHQRLIGRFLLEKGELALQISDLSTAEATFLEIMETVPENLLDTRLGAIYGQAQIAARQGKNRQARELGEQCLKQLEASGNYRISEVRAWLQTLPGNLASQAHEMVES